MIPIDFGGAGGGTLKNVALVASAVFFFYSTELYAQDRCNDVLQNGTFQTSRFLDSSYFQQIVWSKFLRSSFQSSKTDRSGGLSVPVGELFLGANYSEEQYNSKKSQMQSEYFNQITAS